MFQFSRLPRYVIVYTLYTCHYFWSYVYYQKKNLTIVKKIFHDLLKIFTDVLEKFLDYVVKLEFETTPDYDKCRKMFSDALTNANYPLDGKIDFASPKKAAKKVGRTSAGPPVKRKTSSPIKRKAANGKSKQTAEISSDEDDDDDDDSFEVSKPSPKKSKSKTPAAKNAVTNKVVMKDQGCQTSPAFVKAADKAKKQRKALSAKASSLATANNPEMEEFAEMAINSAKKVSSARGKKKSSMASEAVAEAENNFGMENPTPAMLALMAKKAEADGAKKSKATKNKK